MRANVSEVSPELIAGYVEPGSAQVPPLQLFATVNLGWDVPLER